jgi:hypothetical protein
MQKRPEILSRQIGGERPAIMRAESRMPVAVHQAGADGDEFQELRIPFQPLDRQLHADDPVRPHRGRFRRMRLIASSRAWYMAFERTSSSWFLLQLPY